MASVSDQSREAVKTEGLDPKDASAVTEGQTPDPNSPHPIPDVEKVIERLKQSQLWMPGNILDQAASLLSTLLEERERLERERDEANKRAERAELTKARLETMFNEVVAERDDFRRRLALSSENVIRLADEAKDAEDRAEASDQSLSALRRAVEEILGRGGQGELTVRDLCYTAFMRAKGKNHEDGGPTDWFTDTLPLVEKGIEKLRSALKEHGHAALGDSNPPEMAEVIAHCILEAAQ